MGCGAERLQRLMSQPPRQPLSLRPLTGRRIVVTRAREQAAELVDALTKLGPHVIAAPTIRIEPLRDLGALRPALADLSRYDWIVLTSQNTMDVVTLASSSTVRSFGELVGREAAACGRFVVAGIGPVTAASARELGLSVAVEAEEYTVPGLVDALAGHFTRDARSGMREGGGGMREADR